MATRPDLSWAVQGAAAGLRVRVLKGLGTAYSSVGIHHLRTCVIGTGAGCDMLVNGEGIAAEHCVVGCDFRGTAYVMAVVRGAVSLRRPDSAMLTPVEVGRATPVRPEDAVHLAGTVGSGVALKLSSGDEDESEIVLPLSTWNNTVTNSLSADVKQLQLYAASGGRPQKRWTGSLTKKSVSFAAVLVEYDTDRRRPPTPPARVGQPLLALPRAVSPSPPPPAGASGSPPPAHRSPSPEGAPASADADAASSGPWGIAPSAARPATLSPPAKRLKRNIFALHPPIPPPPDNAAAAFDAFPAFIVGDG